MHTIDLENQFGGTRFTAAATSRLAGCYPLLDREHDHVVIGASCQQTAFEGAAGWGNCRLVWTPGHDGADLALADVLLNEDVERRFTRVVIGSGDGLFAPVAAHLASKGIEVIVVARRGHLSRSLRLAAHHYLYLPEAPFAAATAATAMAGTVHHLRSAA